MKKIILVLFTFIQVSVQGQSIIDLMLEANENGEAGKYEEAIQGYNKILDIDPDNSMAIVFKGLVYISIQETDSACACFIDGIELGSQNSMKYFPKYCTDYRPNVNTNNFKQGRFKYSNNDIDSTAYFIRNEGAQTEYFKDGKTYAKFRLKWNSDSDYTLKFIESNDPDYSFLNKGDKMNVKLLRTNENRYLYMSNLFGNIMYGIHEKQ